jgi:3-methylfumaryl-CoA hydratase
MADIIATDRLEPGLLARFQATLGPWLAPVPDGTAPLGAHWCLFPPLDPTDSLGPDGHPPRLHPISQADYPRRMWVGGSLELHRPFPVDTAIERHTSLRPVETKQGSSGPFLLTGLDHRYTARGTPIATERQDIVYRPAHQGPPPPAPPTAEIPPADVRAELETPPALLVRYSALTFNAHLIHTSDAHATTTEGHEGLLVHGPLQATILLNLVAQLSGSAPSRFRYRAVAPLVAGRGLIATAARTADGIVGETRDRHGRRTLAAHANA